MKWIYFYLIYRIYLTYLIILKSILSLCSLWRFLLVCWNNHMLNHSGMQIEKYCLRKMAYKMQGERDKKTNWRKDIYKFYTKFSQIMPFYLMKIAFSFLSYLLLIISISDCEVCRISALLSSPCVTQSLSLSLSEHKAGMWDNLLG